LVGIGYLGYLPGDRVRLRKLEFGIMSDTAEDRGRESCS